MCATVSGLSGGGIAYLLNAPGFVILALSVAGVMIFLGVIVLVQGREIQRQELKRQVSDELKQQANINRPQFQNTKTTTNQDSSTPRAS